MKLVVGLIIVAVMAFAGNKADNNSTANKIEFKEVKRIGPEGSTFWIECVGEYAFIGRGLIKSTLYFQPLSILTGKPMTCDEARKAFFK